MLFVQLEVNWPDNEKVIDAGWECAGVHAGIMCIAKRLDSDGWVPLKITARYEMPEDVIDRLVKHGLLEREGDRVRPNDWHDRNPTKAALAAKKAAKVRAGKAGNHTRYGHLGDVEHCRICNETTSVLAPAIAEPRNLANTSHPISLIDIDTAASGAALARREPPAGVFDELRQNLGQPQPRSEGMAS